MDASCMELHELLSLNKNELLESRAIQGNIHLVVKRLVLNVLKGISAHQQLVCLFRALQDIIQILRYVV